MNEFTILWLLTLHFIADFVFQSDWMAVNKSKSWKALLAHTAVYSSFFILATWSWQFVLLTFVLHTLTDAVTSRITSYLWQKQERHWFFVVIGADQLIHYWTLILTFRYLFV